MKTDFEVTVNAIRIKLSNEVTEKLKFMYENVSNREKKDDEFRKEIACLKKADEIIHKILNEVEKENS